MERRTSSSRTREGREPNPLYVLATQDQRARAHAHSGSIEARYRPLSWLSFDANVSYDRSDRRITYFLDQGLKTRTFGRGRPGSDHTDARHDRRAQRLDQREPARPLRR